MNRPDWQPPYYGNLLIIIATFFIFVCSFVYVLFFLSIALGFFFFFIVFFIAFSARQSTYSHLLIKLHWFQEQFRKFQLNNMQKQFELKLNDSSEFKNACEYDSIISNNQYLNKM